MKVREQSIDKLPQTGFSLVEMMVAMAVLAVMLPLGLAAISVAGENRAEAEAETRAVAIADVCLVELHAARHGESAVFDAVVEAESFPAEGEVMALAFGRHGQLLGAVESRDYRAGLDELDGASVDYLGKVSGLWQEEIFGLEVAVEFPAVKPAERREKITFHTRVP